MTSSQITLLRELIDSTDYRVYVKLNGKRELATQLRIGSKKSLPAWEKARETETDPYIKDFLKKMEEKAAGK